MTEGCVKPSAVALLSGGLDSTVSLGMAVEGFDVELALFFDYGQRALKREREAVTGLVSYYSIPFREVDLRWLGELAPEGMRDSQAGKKGGEELKSIESVWIPNRNGVFINVAASFAERYGIDYVIAGFNSEEAVSFPDNRREFVARLNRSLAVSTMSRVKVVSPTQDLDKKRIIEIGMELSVPLSIIWSCYHDGDSMCGGCASCSKLKEACRALPPEKRPKIEFAS